MKRLVALLFVLAGLLATPAFAQSTYPTPAGQRVNGVVPLTCDGSGANCSPQQGVAVPFGSGSAVVTTPTTSSGAALTPVVSAGVTSALVAKASAGNLYGWQVTSGASAGYVLIINATASPADGAVTPLQCVAVAANATVGAWTEIPDRYATGIVIVFSTTGCYTKTASATAFIRATVL